MRTFYNRGYIMCEKCVSLQEEIDRLTKETFGLQNSLDSTYEQYMKLKNAIDKIGNIVTDVW